MSRGIMTEYRAEIGSFLILLFAIASFLGIVGIGLGPELKGGWSLFQDIIDAAGNWIYWLALLGVLGLVFSLWWMSDYVIKCRKLRGMLDTTSKAKFIKNMDETEYIAWRLPQKYGVRVVNKKKELKIKP